MTTTQTDATAGRLAPHLEDVRAAADKRLALFTTPVLEAAAALLADLLDTGERHGVDPRTWDDVTYLPAVALDAAALRWRFRGPRMTDDDAAMLRHKVTAALRERGIRARPDGRAVMLPAGHHATAVHEWPLILTVDVAGWDLQLERPHEDTLAVAVHAPYDAAGVAALADLLAAVHRGEHGDIFGR